MKQQKIFYHGLPTAVLESVLEQGLLLRKSKCAKKAIFLSSSRETAENYRYMHNLGLEEWSIVGVNAADLDQASVAPDDFELSGLAEGPDAFDTEQYLAWKKVPATVTLNLASQIAYKKDIEPSKLTVYSDCLVEEN